MFERIKEWWDEHFPNYRAEWEQQNRELDIMRCSHGKETTSLKNKIKAKQTDIDNLTIQVNNLKEELSKTKESFAKHKTKSKEQYLDLMNKYQDATLKVQDLITEKRKLSSSKGGLNTKVRYQDKKIKQLETENNAFKSLIQKVVKESGRKLTPPTIQELRNYNLYGNRKGRRK